VVVSVSLVGDSETRVEKPASVKSVKVKKPGLVLVKLRLKQSTRCVRRYGKTLYQQILVHRIRTGDSAVQIAHVLGCSHDLVSEVLRVSLQQIEAAPNN